MKKHGKRYREVAPLVQEGKLYSPADAVELVKKVSYSKFDGTVEMHCAWVSTHVMPTKWCAA